ncbi:MAG: serine/threonine-protein kinase, partial [Myxococcota bacterium]
MSRPVVRKPAKKPLPQLTQARRFGRYWLLRLIARGGMGEVYLAATTGIEGAERPCVVKIIRREHANDSSFLARFLDEARVQAQLHHPGVVQVIEAAKDEKGEPFVVVEYVEGRSLGEVRARALQVSYRLPWTEAVALAMSTAEALAHIHERVDVRGNPLGIVHRDMSPQNIMVGYGGDVKLIDFGTARGENRRCHTVSGVVFAKPGYVAPEVANGNTGDSRVDVYALGIMLWELAAGRRFLQGDAAEHLAKVGKNACSPPPIAQLIGAPAALDEIIAKLTAFDADERYGSARDALRDLAGLLSNAPSLPNGERGVRARISQLMTTLYPSEPTQSRRLFARLVADARRLEKEGGCEVGAPTPEPESPVPEADDRLLPGTRYRILRKIGQGAMGTVFEAEHIDLGRRVAIKVLSAEHATSSDYAARFRREARALSRLSHPNLVTLHDFGQATDGRLYCAMEFLEGQTLEKCLERDGALPWREALGLGAQAASALRDAHRVGLIHRDLKPSNLFLCEDGTLKLLDFGVARKQTEATDNQPDLSSFTLFGTPEYMAPEQVASGTVDERADVYALGSVLYEMVTGRQPHVAPSTVALLDAKTKRDPEAPRERAPSREIPTQVDRLILRALARVPNKRTASADQLLRDIQAALDAPVRMRNRRRFAARVVLAAGFAFAMLSLVTVLARRHPDHVQAAIAALTAAPSLTLPPGAPETQPDSLAQEPVAVVSETSEPAAAAEPVPTAAELAVRAERAAQHRQWPAAVQAARAWVEGTGSRESRLFLARMLLHTGGTDEARTQLEALAAEDQLFFILADRTS